MKVKELQNILAQMNPNDDLRLYCGGEAYREDHPLDGVEYYDDTGFICFNLTDEGKYGIGRQIDIEDFENSVECLDGNLSSLDCEERECLIIDFEDALANNDTYNAIYNETLQEVIAQQYPNIFEEIDEDENI